MDRVLDENGRFVAVKTVSERQGENEATLRREIILLTHTNEDLQKRVEGLTIDLLGVTEELDKLKKVHVELVNEIPKLNKRSSKKAKDNGST